MDADRTYDVSLALESEESHDHASEEEHDHASETSAEGDHEITEVTDCHAHTTTLYCIAGGEEWQVTTDVDVDNAPDSYAGCHSHGENELYVL